MDQSILNIFQREIERQCNFAMIAFDGIKSNFLNLSDKNKDMKEHLYSMDMFWYSIQNFLIAVGDISKILWPPNSKYQQRGEELRKILNIKDNSPLYLRSARNYFEHFDERIEEWATSSKSHTFADTNIGPLKGPSKMIGNLGPKDYMRHFDQTTWTLFFSGDEYELNTIIKAIDELYRKVHLNNP
jgi:hypothetical protein